MYELEYEWEALPELEAELEGEQESEEFFRRLVALARRAGSSPALRRIGHAAARSALQGLTDLPGIPGGPRQAEYELESEGEEFVNPLRRVYSDALMEHMGHAAAEAESEAEAEAFLGALIPLAARLIPRVAPAIMRAAPGLIRGVSGVARVLHRNPATRQLIRTVPTIVQRTAASIAQQAAQGRPVTSQAAVRTLARQTARILGNPQQAARAYRRSRALDRRYHRATGVRTPRRVGGRQVTCPNCAGRMR